MTWPSRAGRPRDHALVSRTHRNHNRAYWQRLRRPCARCGCAIDYDGPEYVNGVQNLRYLVVGHIVSRARARALGWTEAQINDLSNTQPECRNCSNNSGAEDAQRARAGNSAAPAPISAPEASRW